MCTGPAVITNPDLSNARPLLGQIRFINNSVVGEGRTSEPDMTPLPKLSLSPQPLLVSLHGAGERSFRILPCPQCMGHNE